VKRVGFIDAPKPKATSAKTVIIQKVNAGYSTGKKITHLWYKIDDIRQQYVQYAYDIGWIDLVLLMECENWQRTTNARGDNGKAIWLCQMNINYHKLPDMYYQDRRFQVEYCANKRKWGTVFYWPQRIIKWQKCSSYVLDRFKIE